MRWSWILYCLLSIRLHSPLGLGLLSCCGYWEALHAWISVPVCLLCMLALAGNAFLLWLLARHLGYPCTNCWVFWQPLTWFWPHPQSLNPRLCSGVCQVRSPMGLAYLSSSLPMYPSLMSSKCCWSWQWTTMWPSVSLCTLKV